MEKLITELIAHPRAWPFLKPVNEKEVPDYYQIIKHPMGKSSHFSTTVWTHFFAQIWARSSQRFPITNTPTSKSSLTMCNSSWITVKYTTPSKPSMRERLSRSRKHLKTWSRTRIDDAGPVCTLFNVTYIIIVSSYHVFSSTLTILTVVLMLSLHHLIFKPIPLR